MVKMGLTALLFTAVLFCEIFACVVDQSGKMAIILVPLLLMPAPLILLRACGGVDDFMSTAPKGRHCALMLPYCQTCAYAAQCCPSCMLRF